MTTEQSNVGKGGFTNPFDSTAENATQTAQNDNGQQSRFKTQEEFEEWYNTFQDEYFLEVSKKRGPAEYIRHILNDLYTFYGQTNPTATILKLCEEGLSAQNGLSTERTIEVKQILNTCRLLANLREYVECLSNETSDFESEGPKA